MQMYGLSKIKQINTKRGRYKSKTLLKKVKKRNKIRMC